MKKELQSDNLNDCPQSYNQMPATIYYEPSERRERERVQWLNASLVNYVAKFREAGVTITSVEDLK